MKIKNSVLFIILFFYISVNFAQNSLNAYAYIIIPKKYDFLKEENKYQLNALTKFLFDKQGYKTLMQYDSYPLDLTKNACLAATVSVVDMSKMFASMLVIELRDCKNKVIFTSEKGRSKEKDYKKSYHQALRNAFISIENMEYNFDPSLLDNSSSEVLNSPVSVPVVAATAEIIPSSKTKDALPINERVYKNNKISFSLQEENNSLIAYANKGSQYKEGEKIGVLKKTSRPNVYRVSWKNEAGNFENTTGYFDEKGSLNIDIEKNGLLEVLIFDLQE